MKKIKDIDYINKITERVSRKLIVEEVYLGKEKIGEAINYLKKQKYLEFEKIEILIKKNFISNYPIGYILKNQNNEIVGFMGTIFSIRNYGEKDYVYCNIHTWIVDTQYRIYTLLLLKPLISKNFILTAFTPVKTLVGLLEKFGFEQIKMKYHVIYLFKLFNFFKNNQYKIINDFNFIKKNLNKKDLKIFNDYINFPCDKFIIIDENQISNYIFIIAKSVKRKNFNILNLLYVSNTKQFKKNWNILKYKISEELGTNFLGQYFFNEDESLFPKKNFFSRKIEKKSCIKKPFKNIKFDVLYSDLIE